MTHESKHREVLIHFLLPFNQGVHLSCEVIPSFRPHLYMINELLGNHLSEIPKFQQLIFTVRCYVNFIAFARYMCDAL